MALRSSAAVDHWHQYTKDWRSKNGHFGRIQLINQIKCTFALWVIDPRLGVKSGNSFSSVKTRILATGSFVATKKKVKKKQAKITCSRFFENILHLVFMVGWLRKIVYRKDDWFSPSKIPRKNLANPIQLCWSIGYHLIESHRLHHFEWTNSIFKS